MNFLGSSFSHLWWQVVTPKSAIRAGVGETSGFLHVLVFHFNVICIFYIQDIEAVIRGQQRHAIHSLSRKKSGDDTSSTMDGQSSAGTTFCFASLVSNSASSSSVVSAHMSNLRVWDFMACFTTMVAHGSDQSSPPTCINVHGHWMTWGWSDMCLSGLERKLDREAEWTGKGGRDMVSRSEGLIRGSILIYVSGCLIPCTWSSIGGTSICHCCDCILNLWV